MLVGTASLESHPSAVSWYSRRSNIWRKWGEYFIQEKTRGCRSKIVEKKKGWGEIAFREVQIKQGGNGVVIIVSLVQEISQTLWKILDHWRSST